MKEGIVIVGNAGSGKTTLGRALAGALDRPLLSLDDVVWHPDRPRLMRAPSRQRDATRAWLDGRANFVVEGAYADLAALALPRTRVLIWLTTDPAVCAARVRARSAPLHGFPDTAARDARVDWIARWAEGYGERQDRTSAAAHRALAARFDGVVLAGESVSVAAVRSALRRGPSPEAG